MCARTKFQFYEIIFIDQCWVVTNIGILDFSSFLLYYVSATHKLGFNMMGMFKFPFFSRLFNSRLYNRYNTNVLRSQHTSNYEGCISDTESMHSELVQMMHLDAHELEVEDEEDECNSIDEYFHDNDGVTIPLLMDDDTWINTNELSSSDMDDSTAPLDYDYIL